MTLPEQPAELIDRPPAAGPPKVTISRSAPMPPDISGPDVEVPVPSAPGADTPVQARGDRSMVVAVLGRNTAVSGLVAGLVAGLLAAPVGQVLVSMFEPDSEVARGTRAVVAAVIATPLLYAWSDVVKRSSARTMHRLLIGCRNGLIVGVLASLLGGVVWGLAWDMDASRDTKAMLAAVGGWAVSGALVGIGATISDGERRAVAGFIGGVVGGALGGAVWSAISSGRGEDFGAYLIALPVAGAILGLWIGLAGFVSARVRVRFLDGPLAPGSFDGWKRSIRVGDAPQADLYVPVTPGRPVDVTVTPAGDVVRVEGAGIMAVNGQPNEAKVIELREGDLVSLGDHHCTITWKA